VWGSGCAHAAMQKVLVRGLVQAPVPGAQRLDEITRLREGDPLLERDVDVSTTVGRVILNPSRTAGMQPRLDGADIGFDPVNTSNGRVKVKENRSARTVLPENPDRRWEAGQGLSESALVLLRVRLACVPREANSGLTCEDRRQGSPRLSGAVCRGWPARHTSAVFGWQHAGVLLYDDAVPVEGMTKGRSCRIGFATQMKSCEGLPSDLRSVRRQASRIVDLQLRRPA
jgi:hypothetical protein